MTRLFIYLFLALGVSFLCSLLEAVILSVSHAHIGMKIKKKAGTGPLLRKLKENLDRSLSAILTLNTVAHTVGAAGVGAEVHKIYGNEYVTVASAVLTVLVLVFSEIIPKTIGASQWRHLSNFTAYTIQILIYITYPLVVIFDQLSKLISKDRFHPKVTRDEMALIAELGEREGIIQKKEALVIKNILELNKVLVKDVMTPRSVVFSLQKSKTVEDVVEIIDKTAFSRIPVFDDDLNDASGYVFRHKILEASSDDYDSMPIGSLMNPIYSVRERDSVAAVLDLAIKRREHLFLVRDQKDHVVGIVTLEDSIETLLGVEIVDEVDTVADMRQLAPETKDQ